MFLKKVALALLTLFFAFMPVANTAIVSVLYFYRKRKVWAFVFLGLTVLCFITLWGSSTMKSRKDAAHTLFATSFYDNLQSVRITSSGESVRSTVLQNVMPDVLVLTVNDVIKRDIRLADLFKNIKDNHLSYNEQRALSALNERLYDHYLAGVQGKKGNDKYTLAFGMASEEQEYVNKYANEFLEKYIDEETGTLVGSVSWIFVLAYLFGCFGLIIEGIREVFRKNQQRANLDSDLVTERSRREEETVVTAVGNQRTGFAGPPPLPVLEEDENGDAELQGSRNLLNVNLAGEEELVKLPGINRIVAKGIVSERTNNGYYIDINDLVKRIGLTDTQAYNLEPLTRFFVKSDSGRKPGGRVIEF